jgi:hypothetical protein
MPIKHFIYIASDNSQITKLISIILAMLAPLAVIIHLLLFLLVLDAVTSIYFQIKTRLAGMKGFCLRLKTAFMVIESRKLRITLEKMVFYVLALIVFFLFDKYILHIEPINIDDTFTFSLTNFAAVLVCMTELTSIMSNLSKITNNPIFNRITKILQKKVNNKFNT